MSLNANGFYKGGPAYPVGATGYGVYPNRRALPFRKRVCGSLLEIAAEVAGVAVAEIRALHHQDIGDALHGIHPRLSAPCAAVAVGARREHSGHAIMGRA